MVSLHKEKYLTLFILTKDLMDTIRHNIENISFDGDTKKEREIKTNFLLG